MTKRVKNRVFTAEAFYPGAMGSLGDASGMLLRQYKFPDTYAEKDTIAGADHDRIISWDRDHWDACIEKYRKIIGERSLDYWAQYGKPKDILAFLSDIFSSKSMSDYKDITWTGFRILGTVNRSSGYPVYTLQLFAKHKDTKTKVYSTPMAPNVQAVEAEGINIIYGAWDLND